MSVQMVRCEIQNGTHIRMEIYDCLKLEAAYLCYCVRILICRITQFSVRDSYVSNNYRAGIVRLYYLSHKSCCGGLTVCSCYCCYLALAIMICKFYLTPDRYSSISDYVCERSVNRYSRTYDHDL